MGMSLRNIGKNGHNIFLLIFLKNGKVKQLKGMFCWPFCAKAIQQY